MRSIFHLVAFFLVYSLPLHANTLGPAEVRLALIARFGAHQNDWRKVNGTSAQTIRSSGSAGFLNENKPFELAVVAAPDTLCVLELSNRESSTLTVDDVAVFAALVRSVSVEYNCRGRAFNDAAGKPHLFFRGAYGDVKTPAVWVSSNSAVPVHFLRSDEPTLAAAETLMAMAPLPKALIVSGETRIAYVAQNDAVRILFFADLDKPIDLGLCDIPEEPWPYVPDLWRAQRYGQPIDLAYQMVVRSTSVDLLAYFACK